MASCPSQCHQPPNEEEPQPIPNFYEPLPENPEQEIPLERFQSYSSTSFMRQNTANGIDTHSNKAYSEEQHKDVDQIYNLSSKSGYSGVSGSGNF